jgi:Thiopurine S-methyltransferase (TPMT)
LLATLVAELEGVAPGRALDVGCGEGADAIWLAGQDWQVSARQNSPLTISSTGTGCSGHWCSTGGVPHPIPEEVLEVGIRLSALGVGTGLLSPETESALGFRGKLVGSTFGFTAGEVRSAERTLAGEGRGNVQRDVENVNCILSV